MRMFRHSSRCSIQRQKRSWARSSFDGNNGTPASRLTTGSSSHSGRRRRDCSTSPSLISRTDAGAGVGGVSVIDPDRDEGHPNLAGEELQPRRPRAWDRATRRCIGCSRIIRHATGDPVPHHRHHQHRAALSTALSSPTFRSAAVTRSGSTREPGTTSSRLATTWRRASPIRYLAPSMPRPTRWIRPRRHRSRHIRLLPTRTPTTSSCRSGAPATNRFLHRECPRHHRPDQHRPHCRAQGCIAVFRARSEQSDEEVSER